MKNIHKVQVTFEDKISEKLIIIWRIILRLKKFHMQLMNIMLWMSQARHIEIQITQTFTPLFIKSDSKSTCTLSAFLEYFESSCRMKVRNFPLLYKM